MNLERFLQRRHESWRRLEELLTRAQNSLSKLSSQDITTLGRLYRATTSDLALAQREYPNQLVTAYLNQLVGRAHTLVYQTEPLRWRQLVAFYRHTFPPLYREFLPYTIVSFAFFIVTGIVCYWLVWQDIDLIYVMQGPEIAPLVRRVEQGELWTEIAPAIRSQASAFILTNNIQVMFFTFAGGITGGLLTIWILIINGIGIGSIFGLLQAHGMAGGLWEFVAAHGPIELSVIFLAGGCGLAMGDSLLRPGLLTRRASLTRQATRSVRLILGCVPLLVLAGILEGFISPSGLPWPVKLAVGVVTGLGLHIYWLWGGKRSE